MNQTNSAFAADAHTQLTVRGLLGLVLLLLAVLGFLLLLRAVDRWWHQGWEDDPSAFDDPLHPDERDEGEDPERRPSRPPTMRGDHG